MLALSLFRGGVLQVWDVIQSGTGTPARRYSPGAPWPRRWMRMSGDLVFIVFGAVPLFIAAVKGWRIVHADERTLVARAR